MTLANLPKLPDLSGLPEFPAARGGDPALLRDELLHTITVAINTAPRSLQTALGPSELGHPCDRWLSYRLAGAPGRPETKPNWKATVGTAVHTWLQDVFLAENAHNDSTTARWLIEQRVTVGQVAGVDITGHCDLYDRLTATVVDWKTAGPTMLAGYRRKGPSATYRVQAHLYARGYTARGLPVGTVAICWLPRQGELSDAAWWAEPYDPALAEAALARVHRIAALTAALGPAAPAVMATADEWCATCPFYSSSSADLSAGCPGVNRLPGRPPSRGPTVDLPDRLTGDPPPSPFGAPESMTTDQIDANALLMGGGVASAKFEDIGATVTGRVVAKPTANQQTDFKTGAPKTYDNGDPMMQVVVELATADRDPDNPEDDGHRKVYIKGKSLTAAVRAAVLRAGAPAWRSAGR